MRHLSILLFLVFMLIPSLNLIQAQDDDDLPIPLVVTTVPNEDDLLVPLVTAVSSVHQNI